MSKILKTINNCKKQNLTPNVALATIALLFHGNEFTDQQIFKYCEDWVYENGEISYENLRKFAKKLGYIGEIVEIWMEQCLEKNWQIFFSVYTFLGWCFLFVFAFREVGKI